MLGSSTGSVSAQSSNAQSLANYPQLHENKTSSDNYEIVKLIDGPIDSIYSNKSTGEFIAQSDAGLWKINARGEVIDYFGSRNLYASGLIIEKEGIIDWVLTGDTQVKPYTNTIDTKGFSQKKLFEAFDQADLIEFDQIDESLSHAYLYKQGQAWILDISSHGDKIDDFYLTQRLKKDKNLRSIESYISASEFENYQKKNKDFQFLSHIQENSSQFWEMKSVGFEKELTHRPHSIMSTFLENLARKIFTSRSSSDYGYSAGYIKYELSRENESIKFSIFGDMEYDEVWAHKFSWLGQEEENSDGVTFFTLNYRRENLAELNEMSLLPYYEKDVGLYAVRKKTSHNKNANSIAWQPSYSGFHSYDSIWGQVHFAQKSQEPLPPVYYWFWQVYPSPEDREHYWPGRSALIASPILKTIPESITLHRTEFRKDGLFRLVVNGRDAFFYDKDRDVKVAITLKFDSAELNQTFQQLSNSSELIQLNLHVEEKPKGAELFVHLQNSKQRIPLKKIHFDYQEVAYTPKSPDVILDKGQSELFSAYENSLIELNPDTFLKKSQVLIDSNSVSSYASTLSYYFSSLSHEFNIRSKFPENTQLVNFYLDKIHPLIRNNQTDSLQHSNLIIFASQAIYVGSNTQNRDLNNRIAKTFVEQDFDLSQETNRVFLFNMACHYAVNHNKPQMLKLINRSVELGKMTDEFLKDPDFQDYWQDPDFLSAIKKDSTQ